MRATQPDKLAARCRAACIRCDSDSSSSPLCQRKAVRAASSAAKLSVCCAANTMPKVSSAYRIKKNTMKAAANSTAYTPRCCWHKRAFLSVFIRLPPRPQRPAHTCQRQVPPIRQAATRARPLLPLLPHLAPATLPHQQHHVHARCQGRQQQGRQQAPHTQNEAQGGNQLDVSRPHGVPPPQRIKHHQPHHKPRSEEHTSELQFT